MFVDLNDLWGLNCLDIGENKVAVKTSVPAVIPTKRPVPDALKYTPIHVGVDISILLDYPEEVVYRVLDVEDETKLDYKDRENVRKWVSNLKAIATAGMELGKDLQDLKKAPATEENKGS